MISRKILALGFALSLVASTSFAEKAPKKEEQPTAVKENQLVVISAWARKKPDIQMEIQKTIINTLKPQLSIIAFRDYKNS